MLFFTSGILSCNDFLDREPLSDITPELYFNDAEELGGYALKYYNKIFKTTHNGYNSGPIEYDENTDNMLVGDGNTELFTKGNKYVPSSLSSDNKIYKYENIRAMNFFLDKVLPKYESGSITGAETTIKQYIGEVYVLRAYAYFDLLMKFGDLPIVTELLPDDETILIETSQRAPRNEVVRFILSDLDQAIQLLQEGKAVRKQRISLETALLLKSRIALFEATFEKYHKGTPRVPGEEGWPGASMPYNQGKTFNIDGEIQFFLTQAMGAASQVADKADLVTNSKVLNPAINQIYGWNPCFEMFGMPDPSSLDEVILWREYSASQAIRHSWNCYIYRGGNTGATKSAIDAFLLKNGLPIYASSDYQGDQTIDEQKTNRDGRLQLFVFGESDLIDNKDNTAIYFAAPYIIKDVAAERDRTGFRIRKHFTYDYSMSIAGNMGTNAYVMFRAAEAYLNYIEASYLLNGNLDAKAQQYWKALRERADVDTDFTKTIQATDLSKEPDWAKYSGNNLIDATLYNIRRERRCEFIGEGFRKMDLLRWRSYDALFEENMGRYIPEGISLWDHIYTYDYYYDDNGKFLLVETGSADGTPNVSSRTDSKYLRPYRVTRENNQLWDGYQWSKAYYLEPFPYEDLVLASPTQDATNTYLYQNPYWPSTAGSAALE
ncbi:MAG: RagB/SusD family nutrient uptake outer membrane protein [Tannerellaceae bacterium]|nr:RagB/SusD family nutrient uptake outer membrane protein [Tannerellaceae bacterium]